MEVCAAGSVLLDASAAKWIPMSGSSAAQAATIDGHRSVRLPCAFATSGVARASWDVRGVFDFSSPREISIELLCTNPAPVSEFVIYFESGKGWYRNEISPESSQGWNTITIDKSAAHKEGEPDGWDKIKTIRVSAWRGRNLDTEFFIGDLAAAAAKKTDAGIVIIRGDSVANKSADEARSVADLSSAMAEQFRASDIECAVVSDVGLTAESLVNFKLAVLPHNPRMPEVVADLLVQFVARGGKLMTFYSIPEKLRGVLGIDGGDFIREPQAGFFSKIRFADGALEGAPAVVAQHSWNIHDFKAVSGKSRVIADWLDEKGNSNGYAAIIASSNGIAMTHVLLDDDPANKRRMLMAMAGSLAPEIWRSAADVAIAKIGTESGFKSFDEAVARIAQIGGDPARATTLRESAIADAEQKHFAAAIEKASAASRAMLEAWCAAQKPERGEFRAFWCHDAFGVRGIDWDEAIRRLATNGFTAIFPNMLWGGSAFYQSDVLPVVDRVKDRGDQIAACVAACRKYGLQIHVWKVNWNLGYTMPKSFVERMRSQNRLQKDAKGEELLWLCPSHPENQQLETDAMVEVARKYDVDGIHFDYIRYPDGAHCFCDGCRERFEKSAGIRIGDWPKDVLRDGDLRKQWLDWRRENITAVVKAVSEQARVIKPRIKLSAAVFRNWSTDRDTVGQDWKLWCDKGWMDFVCPMDYTASNRKFEDMVASQIEWAGKVPVYPGIGVSASSSRFGPARVIEQIGIARRHHTGGFIIFNYGERESSELLPLLGLGITGKN